MKSTYRRTHILKTNTISEGDLGTMICACPIPRFPERLEHEMLKYDHKYQFFMVSSIFRFASFAKKLKWENDEEFFVLVCALRSAGGRRKYVRIQGFVEDTN